MLRVGDHEVHTAVLEHIRHLVGCEIGVGEGNPDVAAVPRWCPASRSVACAWGSSPTGDCDRIESANRR